MFNILSCVLNCVIICLFGIGIKIWASIDTFFKKKAENLATKQDVTDITRRTEAVQADFHKILGIFDADLKFKYQFNENQYNQLYSRLYWKVCNSEALRYILTNLFEEHMEFSRVPIVEYEREEQMTNQSVTKEMIDLIHKNQNYASPNLIKLVCLLENIENQNQSLSTEDATIQFKCKIKMEIMKTILKDYYWLRQQLRLQESDDETQKLQTETFISIK